RHEARGCDGRPVRGRTAGLPRRAREVTGPAGSVGPGLLRDPSASLLRAGRVAGRLVGRGDSRARTRSGVGHRGAGAVGRRLSAPRAETATRRAGMKGFRAIFKKEFRQIRRDPLALVLVLLVPPVLLVLYGYALPFDVKHTATGVLDEDRTPESRRFLDSLFQNPYFDWKETLARPGEAEPLLGQGRVRVV